MLHADPTTAQAVETSGPELLMEVPTQNAQRMAVVRLQHTSAFSRDSTAADRRGGPPELVIEVPLQTTTVADLSAWVRVGAAEHQPSWSQATVHVVRRWLYAAKPTVEKRSPLSFYVARKGLAEGNHAPDGELATGAAAQPVPWVLEALLPSIPLWQLTDPDAAPTPVSLSLYYDNEPYFGDDDFLCLICCALCAVCTACCIANSVSDKQNNKPRPQQQPQYTTNNYNSYQPQVQPGYGQPPQGPIYISGGNNNPPPNSYGTPPPAQYNYEQPLYGQPIYGQPFQYGANPVQYNGNANYNSNTNGNAVPL